MFNDPNPPSKFRENVWIKAKKYLVCNLPKTDRGGGRFFLTAARLHRALFVCQYSSDKSSLSLGRCFPLAQYQDRKELHLKAYHGYECTCIKEGSSRAVYVEIQL